MAGKMPGEIWRIGHLSLLLNSPREGIFPWRDDTMAAKKTFRELYDEELRKPTAAQQFIRDVSELTHRSEVTVRFWLSGRQVPDELAQTIIAKKYNVDVKHLFPAKEEVQL